MAFADGKHLIDLAEIIFGYREFGYDLWSEIRGHGRAYAAVGFAPFRGEPGGALREVERFSVHAAWEALEGILTTEALATMRGFYQFSEQEIRMACNGPRGGLGLRFRQVAGWKQQGIHYPDP